jgi:hypothetical protein
VDSHLFQMSPAEMEAIIAKYRDWRLTQLPQKIVLKRVFRRQTEVKCFVLSRRVPRVPI